MTDVYRGDIDEYGIRHVTDLNQLLADHPTLVTGGREVTMGDRP